MPVMARLLAKFLNSANKSSFIFNPRVKLSQTENGTIGNDSPAKEANCLTIKVSIKIR